MFGVSLFSSIISNNSISYSLHFFLLEKGGSRNSPFIILMPPIIAFDLETTGLNPKNDAIIEIAMIKFDETGILERYTTLINPGFSLPAESVNITGITDVDLKDAPFFSDIRPKILEFLTE